MRVLTIGTFDLLHEGHIDLFKRSQRLAGKDSRIVIGVNSDEFVKNYKGALPWVPQYSRLKQVEAYGSAQLHEGETPTFIARCNPEYIVIGSDWARKDYVGQLGVTWDWLDERRIGILYVPLIPNISSTIVKGHRDFTRAGHND
jgi:glycerol-3-phosphate cytidylyltransferase